MMDELRYQLFTAGCDYARASLFARGLRRLLTLDSDAATRGAGRKVIDELRRTLKQLVLRLGASGTAVPQPDAEPGVTKVREWLSAFWADCLDAVEESHGAAGRRIVETGAALQSAVLEMQSAVGHRLSERPGAARHRRLTARNQLKSAGLDEGLLSEIENARDHTPATLYGLAFPADDASEVQDEADEDS